MSFSRWVCPALLVMWSEPFSRVPLARLPSAWQDSVSISARVLSWDRDEYKHSWHFQGWLLQLGYWGSWAETGMNINTADIFRVDYFSLDIRGSWAETGMNINTADIFRIDYFSLDTEGPVLDRDEYKHSWHFRGWLLQPGNWGSWAEIGMNINTADIFRVDYFSLDIEGPELRQGWI
jgi:hypothetical protein